MEHERVLVGKNAADIELLWQTMFRLPRWRGGPILNSAISAVEIALWDILGQALGVPVYKLLGGAARSRVRMYLDVGSTPEEFLRAKELGADQAVDYNSGDWPNLIEQQVTLVLDGVAGDIGSAAYKLLNEGGRVVSFGGAASIGRPESSGVSARP